MKILLINTNLMKPPVAPIGLDYLSDSLRASGHEARLLDLCFSADIRVDISSAARSFSPDVVGLSVRNTDDCYFSSRGFFLPQIKEMTDHARRVAGVPVVMGGVGFSVMPEAVMDFCVADYGIAGEGEKALPLLLDALSSGSGCEAVPGLLYRRAGTLHRNASSEAPLDRIPPRARSFIDNPRYFREGGQAGFETKRGCPMGCIYCADPVSQGRRVRLRPARLVVEELAALLAQGIDHFHTCDCEFNIPEEHAREVCRAIIDAGMGERMRWYAYCSITPFGAETALLFRKAGCAGIDFGADSGSNEMLARLGRHFRAEDLARTADSCRAAGIPFMYDLLVGGPGETRKTLGETFDLVRRIRPDRVGVSMGARVYDGTPLADMVRKQGPMEDNPELHGARCGNPRFLEPVFSIGSELGEGIIDYIRELVGNDDRFFLPSRRDEAANYNYNDNAVLVRAIRNGARGAYWDILRRLRV
jgi:radical SAM superfamily enzyme YgiQ (UPF0313 family)